MEIRLVLEVVDESMVNYDAESGLTEDAYMDLYDAIYDAGFDILQGPVQGASL